MKRLIVLIGVLGGFLLWSAGRPAAAARALALTPTWPPLRAEAYDQDVNVRGGPGTDYDRVGTLVRGQSGAILGQAQMTHLWLKIQYVGGPDNTGWVAQDVVKVFGDLSQVPTVLPPPTPTLPLVPTLALTTTLEAAATPASTRMPTFTAPAPVAHPTLLPVQGVREDSGFPPAIFIISLFVLGVFGGLVSLLRRR